MQILTISSKKILPRIAEEIELQAHDLLVWLIISFATGIVFYFGLAAEPKDYQLFWAGCVMAALGVACRFFSESQRGQSYKAQIYAVILLFLACFAFGFSWIQWRTERLAAPILEHRTAVVEVVAQVDDIDRLPRSVRLVLRVLDVQAKQQQEWPKKIRIQFRNLEDVPRKGDVIRARVVMNVLPSPIVPDGYDFQRAAYYQQIGAVGYAVGDVEILEKYAGRFKFENFRQGLIAKIEQAVGAGDRAAVMSALLTGERRHISAKAIDDIRQSGLAHLLAISGLHIGLVASIIFIFSRAFMALFPAVALNFPIKKIAALLALIGATIYMISVGASVPTQRALVMTSIVILAILFDRTVLTMRLWAIAVFIVLLVSPEMVTNVSFQLSFAAVFSLIAFYQWAQPYINSFEPYRSRTRKAVFYLVGVLLTSLVASIATTPYAIAHFQYSSLIGIGSNLLAIPLVAFWIMPMAIMTYIAQIFGVEHWPLVYMGYGVDGLLWIAAESAKFSFAIVRLPEFPKFFIPLFSIGMIVLVLWKGYGKWIGAGFVVISILTVFAYEKPHILIDEKVDIIGFYTAQNNHFYVSNTRRQKFTSQGWATRFATDNIKSWQDYADMQCHATGCLLDFRGYKIAFPETARQRLYDCQHADIVIARTVPRICKAPYKISQFDLRQQGNAALWLRKEGVVVRTVNQARGRRPWVR